MIISSMAEEYYYIAGHIGWADLHDPGLGARLRTAMLDPFLVGLRHDFTEMDASILLEPEVSECERDACSSRLSVKFFSIARMC